MWTVIMVLLFIVGLIAMILGFVDDNGAAIIIGYIVSILVVFSLSIYCMFDAKEIESEKTVIGHVNKEETVINESNGEPTDLYITVDGKEYHIILQETEE